MDSAKAIAALKSALISRASASAFASAESAAAVAINSVQSALAASSSSSHYSDDRDRRFVEGQVIVYSKTTELLNSKNKIVRTRDNFQMFNSLEIKKNIAKFGAILMLTIQAVVSGEQLTQTIAQQVNSIRTRGGLNTSTSFKQATLKTRLAEKFKLITRKPALLVRLKWLKGEKYEKIDRTLPLRQIKRDLAAVIDECDILDHFLDPLSDDRAMKDLDLEAAQKSSKKKAPKAAGVFDAIPLV